MYIVTVHNFDEEAIRIHDERTKLLSGSVVQGINVFDSFTFTIPVTNPAFYKLHSYRTRVRVYNTLTERYEFEGRVLNAFPSMNEKGLLTKEVICESMLACLCDACTWGKETFDTPKSVKDVCESYIASRYTTQINHADYAWTRYGHPMFRGFIYGEGVDLNADATTEMPAASTWDVLKKLILDPFGYEVRFERKEVDASPYDGTLDEFYLHLGKSFGEKRDTVIAVSKNMKSITEEANVADIVTRVYARYKFFDVSTGAVADSCSSFTNDDAVAVYGYHAKNVDLGDLGKFAGYVEGLAEVQRRAEEWLQQNGRVPVKYLLTYLDLFPLGLVPDEIRVGDSYPLQNALLGIDTVGRVTKKTINICDETKSTIEIGESFKTASQMRLEEQNRVSKVQGQLAQTATNGALSAGVSQAQAYADQVGAGLAQQMQGYTPLTSFDALQQAVQHLDQRVTLLENILRQEGLLT